MVKNYAKKQASKGKKGDKGTPATTSTTGPSSQVYMTPTDSISKTNNKSSKKRPKIDKMSPLESFENSPVHKRNKVDLRSEIHEIKPPESLFINFFFLLCACLCICDFIWNCDTRRVFSGVSWNLKLSQFHNVFAQKTKI